MMLRVAFVYALVALASAFNFITENLFADEKIGLTRGARDDCIPQGMDCADIFLRVQGTSSVRDNVTGLPTYNTGPDYVDRLCRAGNETIECLNNLGNCAYLVAYVVYPIIEWSCSPEGKDVYARGDGTTCTSEPKQDTRAIRCREQICTRDGAVKDGAVECLRERWTAICSAAFAEFQIAMLNLNPALCLTNV